MIGKDEFDPDDAFDVCLKKGARAERRDGTIFNSERYERERHYFGYDHGVERFFFNVTDTNYPVRIFKAQHQIDIVHFHGLSWTNQNREFLIKAMRQTDLKLRVILLDPDSDFIEPYAHFIGVKPEYLREKTDEVTKIWIQMHTAHLVEEGKACQFELIYDKGFPAKAMYRFDNSIIVTPTTNVGPKAQFMAYECLEIPGEESSAFSIIEKEIEWLASTGKIVWPRQRSDEAAY